MALPAIPLIHGLREIARGYDALIVDLWGVIHGGVEPYPGVLDALTALRAEGLPVALLSNAPRRAATAIRRLTEIGVPPGAYACLITSGEAAHDDLAARARSDRAALGAAYLYIGPAWDADLVAGLDYRAAATVEEADFLLAVGLFDEADPLEAYDPLFAARAGARARDGLRQPRPGRAPAERRDQPLRRPARAALRGSRRPRDLPRQARSGDLPPRGARARPSRGRPHPGGRRQPHDRHQGRCSPPATTACS